MLDSNVCPTFIHSESLKDLKKHISFKGLFNLINVGLVTLPGNSEGFRLGSQSPKNEGILPGGDCSLGRGTTQDKWFEQAPILEFQASICQPSTKITSTNKKSSKSVFFLNSQ